MTELRQEHPGDGLPPGPCVRAELEAAYQRGAAGRVNDQARSFLGFRHAPLWSRGPCHDAPGAGPGDQTVRDARLASDVPYAEHVGQMITSAFANCLLAAAEEPPTAQ
jgi:hypothetical protein